MLIIKANNLLQKHNSGFTLDITSLEFQEGRIYGLVGPNGAGKSTLLNILNLLENPTEGTVCFRNITATNLNALSIRRRMSMVMEDPFLFNTSVLKNLTSGLSCRGVNKTLWPAMTKEALGMVGLDGFQNRYAPDLSRGESQRVAIARALILKPEVLFLDEPFTNIDRKNVAALEKLVKTINTTYKTTIIFTTHDLSQAYSLSDEVISLVDGKVVKGTIDNLFEGFVHEDSDVQSLKISSHVDVDIVTKKRGKVHISIPPQDIILSHKKILSSARNSFKGTVKKIQMEGPTVSVTITIAKEVDITALITSRSYHDMQLSINSDAFLAFKSTSVLVF